MNVMDVPAVSIKDLNRRLGFPAPLDLPETSLSKSLKDWKMETDDVAIFRYLYRNFRPRRHLEFGTWEGQGVLYCLEECDATVWTINLLEGEVGFDGRWCYNSVVSKPEDMFLWAKKKKYYDNSFIFQTDALGFIGRYYLERGLGNRVCQIYCDSRQWDISNYSEGFFDTVLIDGGHQKDIVTNDTEKGLKLLRSGGLIMWHDFCPRPEVFVKNPTVRGVMRAVQSNWKRIKSKMKDVFWIDPSWILLGIKK